MIFYSTHNPNHQVTLEQAVLRGLAPDNGLYMPAEINPLPASFFTAMYHQSFADLSYAVASHLLKEDLPAATLQQMVADTVQFDAPLAEVEPGIFSVELFHGPTLAFKDFGAKFLAGLLGYFARKQEREVVILAATSGDTGSAVANGFLNVPGTRVVVLYPSGKVSDIQEKQFTTLGANITALEINGTFDDCQRLVKQAFLDKELQARLFLTSANSINIGRLIPQTFYYFRALAQLKGRERFVFSVPSGNFGNLTAGLMAKKMGLPVDYFIAATNENDIVPHYLETGVFAPRDSRATISNAMDVGSPSNFARMLDLYQNDWSAIRKDVRGCRFSDLETAEAMRQVLAARGYRLDPHGAIGYLGLKKKLEAGAVGLFLETAHPGKFKEVVEDATQSKLELPDRLLSFLSKEKKSVLMPNDFQVFKTFLIR